MTPFDVPWTKEWERYERNNFFGGEFGAETNEDLPTTADNPFAMDSVRELLPKPPEPYETWEDTFSYGPPEDK